ncbi:MAG: SDR family NAD(P)-dependent oxidoreductase [Planctomycetota bacterium]
MSDVAVVTGASGALGAAIARALHAEAEGELRLALVCSSRREPAEALARELEGAFVVQADLTSAAGRAELLAAVLAVGAPYVLVNCAGVDRPHEPALEVSEAAVERIFRVNVTAPLLLMQAFGREMARAEEGVIVNVSSVLARRGLTGSAVYGASKAALEALTRQFARELGPRGVRVNAVAPGLVRSPMVDAMHADARQAALAATPLGELTSPEAVAEAVCCCVRNPSLHGAVLDVDGGLSL